MSSSPNSGHTVLVSSSSPRACVPFEITVIESPEDYDQANELNANERKHPQYYFDDGNVIFLVSISSFAYMLALLMF